MEGPSTYLCDVPLCFLPRSVFDVLAPLPVKQGGEFHLLMYESNNRFENGKNRFSCESGNRIQGTASVSKRKVTFTEGSGTEPSALSNTGEEEPGGLS